jgi:hypothetical protein
MARAVRLAAYCLRVRMAQRAYMMMPTPSYVDGG